MKASRRATLSEDERLHALGRLLTGSDIPMRLRIAGIIVLLYAQPLTRVVRLTIDDVLHDGETTLLRLGEPASPIPAPVASLLQEYIAGRANIPTATNPASRWLFPGRRAGQPCRPDHLSALLGKAGVPASAARGAAIRQQLLEMPAPVVAGALATTTKPPPVSSTKPAVNGADTPPEITQGHYHARHPQHATVDYTSPSGTPDSGPPPASLVAGGAAGQRSTMRLRPKSATIRPARPAPRRS